MNKVLSTFKCALIRTAIIVLIACIALASFVFILDVHDAPTLQYFTLPIIAFSIFLVLYIEAKLRNPTDNK